LRLPPLVASVDRALREAGTPARGETLVLGLSGGPDSTALLDALAAIARRRRLRLVAAHLDHRLRPDSAQDAAFCADLCRRLGVALRLGAAEVRARAEREGGGLEQAARRERYAFLRSVRAEERAAAIAIAHTRDDQAETLLLRLLRGAGATGLSAMRPRSGDLLRPLLDVTRTEVLAHLQARGLSWREDPTNADPAHRRNRVRHELLPYLERRFGPGVRDTLARTAGLLADEAAFVRAEAQSLLGRSLREGSGVVALRRSSVAQAPRAVAREALRLALGLATTRAIGAAHVERVLRLVLRVEATGRALPLPGGARARLTRDELQLEAGSDLSGKAL
jgi:tRNA(Ile)-lysidine synthase